MQVALRARLLPRHPRPHPSQGIPDAAVARGKRGAPSMSRLTRGPCAELRFGRAPMH